MKQMTGIAAALATGLGLGLFASAGPAVGAETRVCRGILMANWTGGVPDYTPLGDTRLIMPIDSESINAACLFDIKSDAGRKIMSVCQMGFPCKATVKLGNEPADVFIIGQVLSVVNISKPKQR
jgi:hypothetical protein